jgi:hypothetical protein
MRSSIAMQDVLMAVSFVSIPASPEQDFMAIFLLLPVEYFSFNSTSCNLIT